MASSLHATSSARYVVRKSSSNTLQESAASEKLGGRFGYLFSPDAGEHPLVKVHKATDDQLEELGRKGGPMDEASDTSSSGDSNIPSGHTFLGQFVDHDITLDPRSALQPKEVQIATEFENFRTPNLDLDCVYAGGPEVTPYIYDEEQKLHLGDIIARSRVHDLPRFKKRALIGDPRNDENLMISQLQVAFLQFHNALIDQLHDFEKARDAAIYYYHRMLKEDFLPNIIGSELTTSISASGGRKFYFPGGFQDAPRRPYMPIEFSVAAYRFGHSMVRGKYIINEKHDDVELFSEGIGLKGFQPALTFVDWRYFFDIDETQFTLARKIDPRLPASLMDLQVANVVDAPPVSLAARNLLRGKAFNLWSGQSIAEQMVQSGVSGVTVLEPDEATTACGMTDTPLWYYILQDAKECADGNHLGPVGGRIVGEVLLGLIEHYQINTDKNQWKPEIEIPLRDESKVRMADILAYGNMVEIA